MRLMRRSERIGSGMLDKLLWIGGTAFGHLNDYTELLAKNSSQALETPCCYEDNMEEVCVARQEEMV